MRELRNTKIIAVDHGYGNIKTANTVTPTGIAAFSFRTDCRHSAKGAPNQGVLSNT